MKTITVNTSKAYDVLIGRGLIKELGTYILSHKGPCRCAIISDSNVWPIYRDKLQTALKTAELEAVSYVFAAGEASKSTETYIRILHFLAENHITRSDLIIALGGGVTGDMAGFAAATYLRGIDYIQIPTSLLAMVDSSVGGKTAIDLSCGKNLVGAFYQPLMVLCDIDTLDTLPPETFRDGCAEVIKYAVLFSRQLFDHLMQAGVEFNREKVIYDCVNFKRAVVALDEFDRGQRQLLNLGHTIGHCIEAESNFEITHGQAVAAGLCIIARAGKAMGITESSACIEISNLVKKFNLPIDTTYTSELLIRHALSDKKRTGDSLNLIIPESIGRCKLHRTPVEQLQSIMKSGL